MERMHGGFRAKFLHYCTLCGAGFNENAEFEAHKQKHESLAVVAGYHCTFCPERFLNSSALKRHTLGEHADSSWFKCKLCKKMYSSAIGLAAHEKLHSEKAPTCTICGAKTSSKRDLNYHMQTHSEQRIRYQCEKCPHSYFKKQVLANHVKKVHDKTAKTHTCYFCGKTYYDRRILRAHEVLHSGEQFPCPNCSKVFNSKSYLDQHLRGHCSGQQDKNNWVNSKRKSKVNNNAKSTNPIPNNEAVINTTASQITSQTNSIPVVDHNQMITVATNPIVNPNALHIEPPQAIELHRNLQNLDGMLSNPLSYSLNLSMNSSLYYSL